MERGINGSFPLLQDRNEGATPIALEPNATKAKAARGRQTAPEGERHEEARGDPYLSKGVQSDPVASSRGTATGRKLSATVVNLAV
jgi:hypothetical protein